MTTIKVMIMKKTISRLLAVLIVCCVANNANAQKRDADEWSIIPKVGVNLSKLKGDKIGIGDAGNNYLDFSSRLGYEGGVEVEYMVHDKIGVTLGAMYAMQSEKAKDYHEAAKHNGSDNLYDFTNTENVRVNLGFLNVPLKCNVYLTDNFALKAGVQFGFMLSAKLKYNTVSGLYDKLNPGNTIYYDANGQPAEEGSEVYLSNSKDMKNAYKHFDISIPVGVSYEYENVILEAQYRIGLSDLNDIQLISDKIHSSVFSVTVGYRLPL